MEWSQQYTITVYLWSGDEEKLTFDFWSQVKAWNGIQNEAWSRVLGKNMEQSWVIVWIEDWSNSLYIGF